MSLWLQVLRGIYLTDVKVSRRIGHAINQQNTHVTDQRLGDDIVSLDRQELRDAFHVQGANGSLDHITNTVPKVETVINFNTVNPFRRNTLSGQLEK